MDNRKRKQGINVDTLAEYLKEANLENKSPKLEPQSIPEININPDDKIKSLENTIQFLIQRIQKVESELLLAKVIYKEMYRKVNDNALINKVLADLFEVDIDSYIELPNKKKKSEKNDTSPDYIV
jgi:hypothetical protein